MADPKQDRLFVRDGRRSYRRTYSRAEVRWGAIVLVILASLASWIAWKGRHPDPSLHAPGPESQAAGIANERMVIDGRAPTNTDRGTAAGTSTGAGGAGGVAENARGEPGAGSTGQPSAGAIAGGGNSATGLGGGGAAPAAEANQSAAQAPFPAGLTLPGWIAGPVAHYDNTNLYIKIDGREDYYKSFGFNALHWVSLARQDDDAMTVDIELFDMTQPANALGAYAGERAPDASPQLDANGMWNRARNATFATVGKYYLRLLGADESDAVQAQVEHARKVIVAALPAAPLPWGYTLFAGAMKLDPGKVSFTPENAFSLACGRNVYAAPLGDADLEGFVTIAADGRAAAALAADYVKGFLDYGEDAGTAHGARWVQDRNLKTFATAIAAGTWVVGVRGAATPVRGSSGLARVEKAVRGLDAATVRRARAEAATGPAGTEPGRGAEPGGAEPGGAEPGGAEPTGKEPGR